MCYDDGCHLKKYASNDKRAEQTPTAQKLATMHIVIDKMHFRGHTDVWCQEHCNPYKYDDLDNMSFMSSYIIVKTISKLNITYESVRVQ